VYFLEDEIEKKKEKKKAATSNKSPITYQHVPQQEKKNVTTLIK